MQRWLVPIAASCVVAGAPRAAAQSDPSVEQALAAVRASASSGDAVAEFSLGAFLYYGTAQTGQAVEWFRRAAAQGYAPAEFQMGQIYDFGFGVSPDDKEALSWYLKAANRRHPAAGRAVGDFYSKGRAVAANPAEAARWYRLGAEGDDLRAQFQLGQAYFDGIGLARDYASAYVWFTIAAGQTPLIDNRKQLIELRNIAAARMTPGQAEEAERRAAAWRPNGTVR